MSELNTLFDQLDAFKRQPIGKWHPQKEVEIDIRIAANGSWYYRGSTIERHRIVKLFSTVLRLEGKTYYLVTPPVKYKILVEDVPFVAIELNIKGKDKKQQLFFRTNMDEVVTAGPGHPITMSKHSGNNNDIPYIMVRDGLHARISRPVYYQLVELLQCCDSHQSHSNSFGVYSNNAFFLMGQVE